MLQDTVIGLTAKEWLTFCLGFIGTLLGIYNAWNSIQKEKVKIKVVPKIATHIGTRQKFLAFDITNLSHFPVTITEVGVFYHGSRHRGCVVKPIIIDGGTFPRRLEARTSFSAYGDVYRTDPEFFLTVRCAYATTACGITVEGNSPALQEIISEALNIVLNPED
jgi:hypothetical protein